MSSKQHGNFVNTVIPIAGATAIQKLLDSGNAPAGLILDTESRQLQVSDGTTVQAVSGLGPLASEVWSTAPSVFRLLLTGTGTVTVDAKNSLETITLNVASYTLSSATNQIEYPYLGADATDIRVTLTGTATAEII